MQQNLNTHKSIHASLSGTITHLEENISCIVTLQTTEEMKVDETGLVHGGCIFSSADYAAMCLANHPNVVLGSANVRFLQPTQAGDILTFEAKMKENDEKKKSIEVIGKNEEQREVFHGEFLALVPKNHVLTHS